MSATPKICFGKNGVIEITVNVIGVPFGGLIPKTLTTRDGNILVLKKHLNGYNSFCWTCKDLPSGDPVHLDCSFKNTKTGVESFEMFLAGICVKYGLTMNSELTKTY
jgi:hypothetical protein